MKNIFLSKAEFLKFFAHSIRAEGSFTCVHALKSGAGGEAAIVERDFIVRAV